MPTIIQLDFDAPLRCGTGNSIRDAEGFPIFSFGHIRGSDSDPIVHYADNVHDLHKRYRITITATRDGHNKEWKGRIIDASSRGGWNFVAVLTRNESGASATGDGDVVVTVTVTNPGGSTSPAYTPPSLVPVASVP